MKRSIKIAVAAAMALSATSAFATNGDHLIGMGAKARSMGGIGIGMSHGAETALSNPALITTVQGTEVSFGGTIFMPDVETAAYGNSSIKSDADLSVIPEVAIAQNVGDGLSWGIGMYGTAGMGTDYRDATMNPATGQMGNFKMVTNLSYKSAIDMEYKGQIKTATADFGMTGYSDNLEQPAEIGVGASYTFAGNTIAIDYKQIQWASAKGYKDFKWEDQDVYMIGYQFAQDSWAVRAGYNYAKSPIKEQSVMATDGAMLNVLNLLGFPAIIEEHYTIGGGYAFNKTTSLDLAYMYAPEVTEKFATMMSDGVGGYVGTLERFTIHSPFPAIIRVHIS
ncbi:MAG: outer membrane protein transport protein [Epsilonproteobacteria bacterium]|nr:outer membrane protein transport protein [Campylobacterota bacterium]